MDFPSFDVMVGTASFCDYSALSARFTMISRNQFFQHMVKVEIGQAIFQAQFLESISLMCCAASVTCANCALNLVPRSKWHNLMTRCQFLYQLSLRATPHVIFSGCSTDNMAKSYEHAVASIWCHSELPLSDASALMRNLVRYATLALRHPVEAVIV